jgi:Ca2+-binding RTX toxin-like protein
LNGGAGADTLAGGVGNDTYAVDNLGDVVTENLNEGTDRVNASLSWTLGANLENLTLTGTAAINGVGNERNNQLTGNGASNVLTGGMGNDTLNGGAGADILDGGNGNDTYLFGRGSGADVVNDYDLTPNNIDALTVGSGIATDQLWFRRDGSDLEISIIGTPDKTAISNWYADSAYHVEQFKAPNGKVLLDSQVDVLVSAMAAFAPPAAGQTTLPADYQAALNPVIAANWK